MGRFCGAAWSTRRQLPQGMVSRNLKAMEVHFTPEEDARFRAAAREGIAQADKGEFLEEAEMDARLEQILR